ncbi:MAG: Wzz/FepE/Etk N-terminal domain-containing protein [Candidatus Zixiibacteriota bacterium]
MIRLARVLLKYRYRFMIVSVSLAVVTGLIAFLLPSTYTSRATLLPTGKVDKMADLKSLAGLSSLTSQDESSSELFPTILMSRAVADAVLARRYECSVNARHRTLYLNQYFKIENPDYLHLALAGITTVEKDKKTGVISLAVETTSPELSRQIAEEYITQLDDFNMHRRRTQAGERARYLETQVAQTARNLRAAEDSLEAFQRVNRNWIGGDDPEVSKIVAQLSREVELITQGYGFLRQQLEMAKLDARKDVPVVSVLDRPSLPTVRTGPRRFLSAAAGGVAGLLLVLLWVMVRERFVGARDAESRHELKQLGAELTQAIRWRRRIHAASSSTENEPVAPR